MMDWIDRFDNADRYGDELAEHEADQAIERRLEQIRQLRARREALEHDREERRISPHLELQRLARERETTAITAHIALWERELARPEPEAGITLHLEQLLELFPYPAAPEWMRREPWAV